MRYLLAASLLLVLVAAQASAGTWYVPGDAANIQGAVNMASAGDTVLVAAGTYYEQVTVLNKGIVLASQSGSDVTTIDAGGSGRVMTLDGASAGMEVRGFTITNGRATSDSNGFGAGILCTNGTSVLIRNNRIVGDSAKYGAGIAVLNSSFATIESNQFSSNWADPPRGGHGGAIYLEKTAIGNAIISGNVMIGNSADRGAGVYCPAPATIDGNVITGNIGATGVAIAVECYDAIVTRNVITHNKAWSRGAGILLYLCSPWIAYNTIDSNKCYDLGGGIYMDGSSPTVTNNVVTNSLDGGGIHCVGGQPTFSCNDVWNSVDGNYLGGCPDQTGINGNISADPLFCNAAAEDYAIDEMSPCAPGNSPSACGLIGALPVGCYSAGVPSRQEQPTTWGAIKSMYK